MASDGGFEANGNCTGSRNIKHQSGKRMVVYRGPKDLDARLSMGSVLVEAYLVRDEVVQINDITYDLSRTAGNEAAGGPGCVS